MSSDYEEMTLRRSAKVGRVLLIITVLLQFMAYFLNGSLMTVLFYIYASLFYMSVNGRTSGTNAAIKDRLQTMVDFIKFKANQELSVKNRGIEERKVDLKIIAKLSEIYQKIADGCDERNRCQGFQLMLGFGMIFFYTLFTFFTAYIDIVRDGKLSNPTISSVIFCLFFNFFVATVILTCTLSNKVVSHFIRRNECSSEKYKTMFQAEKININLRKWLKTAKDAEKVTALTTFSMLVASRGTKTTCGFFDFDWKLLFAIAAGAATNFIILMQFDLDSRRKAA